MKKNIALFIVLASFTACQQKSPDAPNTVNIDSVATEPVDATEVAADTLTPEINAGDNIRVALSGRVVGINRGKDGYTAEIKDDSGKHFFATISIPNLNDPKQFREVKEGDRITVKGESWKMDNQLHIKVTELK